MLGGEGFAIGKQNSNKNFPSTSYCSSQKLKLQVRKLPICSIKERLAILWRSCR